jgi:hypothetical protein
VPEYSDLYDLREDERIRMIGEHARHKLVGALLEKNEPKKIARYIKKVTEQFPDVRHLDTTDGPTTGVVTLRFCPKTTS